LIPLGSHVPSYPVNREEAANILSRSSVCSSQSYLARPELRLTASGSARLQAAKSGAFA
jgi:hypothetical protein